MNVSILGIGVATLDIYTIQRRMYPGGNEYNVVCNAKMLGARAGFLGVFAHNPAGKLLEKTLTDLGVDVSFCHHEHGSSGYSIVELKDDGDRIFLEWNQQGVTDLHPISFTQEEIGYVKTFDAACLGRCSSVSLEKIRLLHENDVPVCYDFHAAYTDTDIEAIAPLSTYAFFSCSHLSDEETKRILKKAVDLGCSLAIGTSGADPVIAYDGKQFYTQNTRKVAATDALGAGDSYIGAFLTYYIRQKKEGMEQSQNMQSSLALAADHSAKVVMIEGSIGVGYDVDPTDIKGLVFE